MALDDADDVGSREAHVAVTLERQERLAQLAARDLLRADQDDAHAASCRRPKKGRRQSEAAVGRGGEERGDRRPSS